MPRRKADRVLILKTVDPQMRAHGGFVWPESGPVTCPDWSPTPKCGYGLHGLLWGVGDAGLTSSDEKAKWLVFAADASTVVEIRGKVKVPAGEVVFAGGRDEAIAYIEANGGADKPIIYSTRTAGDAGTATAGYRGTATAGDAGTATAGDRGTATAGYRGTATAGDAGTATAGYRGTATAGDRGTATAGDAGILQIARYDFAAGRYRIVTGYVGEDGIKADTPYKLSERTGKLIIAR